VTVGEALERSAKFGQRLEDIVVEKGSVKIGDAGDRDRLLLAYWSLILDLHKSVLTLIQSKFYGGAFALLRPAVEAQIRAHVVLMCNDDVLTRIKEDKYGVNFKDIGREIDDAFALEGYFDNFLNGARGALHSFTHSGLSQLGRRFKGDDLVGHYGDGEIIEVINTATTATWMVTNLVAKHFKFEQEAKTINELFLEWGKVE
jgi:hypothetical protein